MPLTPTAADADPGTPRRAAALLGSKGYFVDDDSLFSSTVMEKDVEGIETLVRQHGYSGGRLETWGHTCDCGTAVYIVCDSERLDYDDAMSVLRRQCP